MGKKKTQDRSNGCAAGEKKVEPELVALPLAREIPSGQIGVLSNHFVIQHDGPEFHLLFFQTQPPIVLADTEEERRKALEEIQSVRSVCIARIIVSAERLPSIISAMQENLEKQVLQQSNIEEETQPSTKGS